jgi:bifunctional DNA-binding transcriptional regulator/antitoxin component of YhaV-PrlF toxin-antitoxin module
VGAECEKRATISRVERFKAILGGEDGEAPTVELPFDAKERFGRARAPVRGTVDGTEFRTTVAVYGGRYLIGFRRELRERAGVAIGDQVEVTIDLDDEPRTVELPPALAAAFDEDEDAREAFDRLSYSHRREYAEWIAEAKRDDTRSRRVAKTLGQLRKSPP